MKLDIKSLVKEEVKKVLENLSDELQEQKLKTDLLIVYSPLSPLKQFGAFGNGLPNHKYNGHGRASCGCVVCRRYFSTGKYDENGKLRTFGEYLDSVRDYYYSLKDQYPELPSK